MVYDDDEQTPKTNAGSTKGLVTIPEPIDYEPDDVALDVAAKVTAKVELRATPSTAVLESLDLVCVLDVSGSMAGEKLDNMKKAMQLVLNKLTPEHRLSIVTFSNDATRACKLTSVTAAARSEIQSKHVDPMAAGGGTNIKAGLETGLAILNDRKYKPGRTANIFLMSDGQQTANDARDVDPGSVAVYTFGFGKDTDNQLLTDIANKSHGGTFSTVPDGGTLTTAFAQLLAGLVTVVAQDVRLTLKPITAQDDPVNGGDLDTMVVAPGTKYKQTTDPATKVITIDFGYLFAGEVRTVNIDFTLVKNTSGEKFDASLADAQLFYTAQTPSSAQLGNTKPKAQRQVNLSINRTTTPSVFASSKARSVQAEVARRQHADAIGAARAQADKKDLDGARRTLADAQKLLDSTTVTDAKSQQQVAMLRAELQQLLALMGSQDAYDARGRAYALAAETSHGRQRFGDRGDDTDTVRLFATPRMDTYLQQAKQFDKDPAAPLPTAADDAKQEIADNPVSAISTQLAFYIQNAITALQAIEKILGRST